MSATQTKFLILTDMTVIGRRINVISENCFIADESLDVAFVKSCVTLFWPFWSSF